jgi:glycosyltransferase involved in cell wall biosynthesis
LRFSLGRNKRIATVSDFSVDSIRRHWLDGGESRFVSCIYNHAGSPRKRTGGKKRECLRVLTIGNVAWYKNPELWVEVAAGVCARLEGVPVEFVWAGDGPLLERCREAVRHSGRRNIRFIGYHGGVEGLLARSDVYYQPSVLENHGLSIIGAMNRSLPCVVSGAGGNPESVLDGVTGFVLPHEDVTGMTEKLVALLSDGGLRRKMGKAGRERYKSLFCEEIWNENFTALNGGMLRW